MTQRITVHLNEEDVRKDAHDIITAMNAIRNESITEGKVCKGDEYATLAARLASTFKGLFDKKHQPLVSSLENLVRQETHLSNYDRLQMSYLCNNGAAVSFVRDLAALALVVYKPANFIEFFTQNGEYHFFQALKVLAKEAPAPLQEGLPLEKVLALVPVEKMSDPQMLADAYKKCGYATARVKTEKPGTVAETLKKAGYDVRLDEKNVILRFTDQLPSLFFTVAFDYKKIEELGNYYVAQGKGGYALLNCDGSVNNVLGYEWFDGIKNTNLNKKTVVELSIKQDKAMKYAYLDENIPLRWFDKRIDSNALASIVELKKKLRKEHKFNDDTINWLLQSSFDLEKLQDVPAEGIGLVYKLNVKPSFVLLHHAPALTKEVDLECFVHALGVVRAVELPGELSLWEMLDMLPPEHVEMYLQRAVTAYKMHGTKLKDLLNLYQERRSTHETVSTLLQSAYDFISTIRDTNA